MNTPVLASTGNLIHVLLDLRRIFCQPPQTRHNVLQDLDIGVPAYADDDNIYIYIYVCTHHTQT